MSCFGEIVEPGSRAAWEDWDDDSEQISPELRWQRDLESPDEIHLFLILEGRYLSNNMSQSQNLELINCIPEVNLHLYRSTISKNYTCTLRDYNLVLSSQIVELLRQYLIVSKNVVTIQTKSITEYQSLAPTRACIIREISTTKKQDMDIKTFPKLEQPNIISGVSAGVISLREHLDDCGIALVAFLEDIEDTEEIELLLHQLRIITKPKNTRNSILESNIYM